MDEHKELSKAIYTLLHASGKTLSTAESCTAGALAAAIVATSGASEYFKGGIVAYSNEVKEQLLGVAHDTLEEQTAVCEEVAIQMAQGAREALGTDFAVATTGIAGPSGGTDAIPVGTIWLCCSSQTTYTTRLLTADNGRETNLYNAVTQALHMLIDFLKAS